MNEEIPAADWGCPNCDEFEQVFIEKVVDSYDITDDSQEMLAYHMSGECDPG